MNLACSVCKTDVSKKSSMECGACNAEFCMECWPAHDVTMDRKDWKQVVRTAEIPAGPGYGASIWGESHYEGAVYCAGNPRPPATHSVDGKYTG